MLHDMIQMTNQVKHMQSGIYTHCYMLLTSSSHPRCETQGMLYRELSKHLEAVVHQVFIDHAQNLALRNVFREMRNDKSSELTTPVMKITKFGLSSSQSSMVKARRT